MLRPENRSVEGSLAVQTDLQANIKKSTLVDDFEESEQQAFGGVSVSPQSH
jgi:hypothetical protein